MAQTDTETRRRHLAVVPEQTETEEVPVGVVRQQDEQDENERPQQEEGSRALAERESSGSGPGWVSVLGEHTKAALGTGTTCARLAWARRWDTSMRYVMDPDLRQEMLDAAEDSLDERRRQAAKKTKKAVNEEDRRKAQRTKDRLEHRAVSEMEVDARVLRARGMRLARECVVPAAVIVGPVLMAASGMWWALAAWPAAWGWLAMQGRALLTQEQATAQEMGAARLEAAEGVARVGAAPEPAAPAAPETAGGAQVLGATAAETRILQRLSSWTRQAPKRGLDGVLAGAPMLDESGLVVPMECTGKHTPASLEKKVPAIRALLGVPTGTRLEVVPGEVGDQALVRIRTRAKDLDLEWRPERAGIGLDSDTGEVVHMEPGRWLVAGTSGAGKSVLVRVIMASALCSDEPTAVVYIDGKGEESALWRGKARIAVTESEVMAVLRELATESAQRSTVMQQEQVATWEPTEEHPRILVVIDEGAEIIGMDDPKEGLPIVDTLCSLARTGRSRLVEVIWCTQKPTIGEGVPSQVKGVMTERVALRTTDQHENNQVLPKQWRSHELVGAGTAYVKDQSGRRGPDQAPVRVWDLSQDRKVLDLPEREPWRHIPEGAPARAETGEDESGPGGAEEDDWIGAQGAVMRTLREQGPRTMGQLPADTGYSKTMVHNALKQLSKAGRIEQVGGHGSAWREL